MGRIEFLKDLSEAKKQFPFIDYEYLDGKEYPFKITDDFEVSDDEGNHWATFRASVYFHQFYPKEFPILQDLSRIFPWNEDWHISPIDRVCCVCGVIEQEEYSETGISILKFISGYIIPFYANQVYRTEYGQYRNGDYAHDEKEYGNLSKKSLTQKTELKLKGF